jgi:tetratricopeptide (TPR) repeat protein
MTAVRTGVAWAIVVLSIAVSGSAQTAQAPLEETVRKIAELLDVPDLTAAKAAADQALLAYPASAAVHNLAGVIDAQRGAFAAAESHFQRAIALAPRSPGAYENLGRLYQERFAADPQARGKAVRTYESLLSIAPANTEGLYQLAFLNLLAGKFRESRALLDRLPPELQARPQILAVRAAALAGVGNPAATATLTTLEQHPDLTAADVLSIVPAFDHMKNPSALRRMLESLDRRNLATPEALQALGRLDAREGHYAESRAVLERAAASGVSVPLLLDLARAAYKAGDGNGALGYLAHARALEPKNANVHFLFGVVCVELNLAAEAFDALKKAVELDPENPQINYVLGAVATHRHDPSEAIPYFEKYVALLPNDPRGVFALGAAFFYSSQFDHAREQLQKVAERKETAAGAHYYLARIARQSNDLDTARREVNMALQAYPKYADAWAELGLIQTRTAEYAEAEQSLGKALALDPNHYVANVNLATLYSRTKDSRREAQTARVNELQEKRAAQAQEFLRMIQVEP